MLNVVLVSLFRPRGEQGDKYSFVLFQVAKPTWPLGFRKLGSGINLQAKEWFSMQSCDSDLLGHTEVLNIETALLCNLLMRKNSGLMDGDRCFLVITDMWLNNSLLFLWT